jgi:MoaA/NifB/PqqE/SkfB family radical SAM enzyme
LAGGEPTLHPEILDYLREIKKAGYKSNIATNGLTLPQMPDEFFDLVDLFSLSVYANNNMKQCKSLKTAISGMRQALLLS